MVGMSSASNAVGGVSSRALLSLRSTPPQLEEHELSRRTYMESAIYNFAKFAGWALLPPP